MDDVIILLNLIFTDLQGYQIRLGESADKQRHRLFLLKTGIHVAHTNLSLSNTQFWHYIKQLEKEFTELLEEILKKLLM